MKPRNEVRIVGDSPWEALVKVESIKETNWSKDHRSFEQLRELRRLSGQTYGNNQMQRWLKHLIVSGKVRADRGREKNINGHFGPVVRYIFI